MTQLERLDKLLSQQEAAIVAAFATFVREATSDKVIAQVADRIDAGDIEGALGIADGYIAQMAVVLSSTFQAVGAAAAVELAQAAPDVLASIHFDPTHPRAAAIMRTKRLEFIAGFTDDQRIATRTAMERAFLTGQGTQATARAFRDSVGLTPFQENAVVNYGNLLRRGSREALDRSLRDRRYDRSVERAVAGGKPLTEEQIDKMVSRYRDRYRTYRADVIARTEAVRVMSEAREEATLQTLEQTGMDEVDVKRKWNATIDARTRHSHAAMNGQKRNMGEAFTSGAGVALRYPGDANAPLSETASCRCVLTYDLKVPAQAAVAILNE